MENYKERINKLKVADYSVYPDIDLYMDQVLAYISRTPVSFRESDSLTSAMVNNYIKDGLIPRAKGKKYSKEHIADLTVIARLKQVFSVKDVGVLLSAVKDNKSAEEFYKLFAGQLEDACEKVSFEIQEREELTRLAMNLAVESYINKVACEYLLDSLVSSDPNTEEKKKKKSADKN